MSVNTPTNRSFGFAKLVPLPGTVAGVTDCRYRGPQEAAKQASRRSGSLGESTNGLSIDIAERFEPVLYLSRFFLGVFTAAFGRLEVLLLIIVTNRM